MDSNLNCDVRDASDPCLAKERLAYKISEVVALTGICRTGIFEAIRSGRLQRRKWGSRTLILREDLIDFLHSLPHR
jgi:hypothetical protein